MNEPLNEDEEFEFLYQMEREAQMGIPPPHPTTELSEAPEPPLTLAVAGQAAAKGVAGMVDMFGNAPANLLNVGKYIAGETMEKIGLPMWEDIRVTKQPNFARRGMEAIGLITPENEPQTPGQRILDMAVQAGVAVAASPASSVASVAKNIGIGMASGTAAGVTKEVTGSDLAATAVGAAVPLAANLAMASRANAPVLKNPTLKATLTNAQKAGYVVPPSQVKPSATTNRLESVAGKAAIRQEAAAQNQQVTNRLAAKALGLPDGTPITKDTLEQVRQIAAKPYQEVEALRATVQMPWFKRFHSTSLLDDLKQARADAQQTFTHYNRTADPATLAKAKAFRAEAEALEDDIARIAQASGKPDLVQRLKAGRQLYARTYDVERATNFADGNVSARVLGQMFGKGKPLTGELAVIGRFAKAYPSVTRDAAAVPASGVSGTEAGMTALLGTVGYGAAGGPAGLVAAGLPLLRGPARSMLLSKGYQSRLLKESPGLTPALYQSALAGRAIAEAP